MVKKVESFISHDGKIFLNEEAAVRHECLQRLCEIIPEFQMVRPRIEAQLDAVATAMGPMVAYRARVPSKGPIVDPSVADHGELAGTCDCSAGMNGASDHARSCPSYRPVAVRCQYAHPPGTRCPVCQDVPSNVTVIPAPEARARA